VTQGDCSIVIVVRDVFGVVTVVLAGISYVPYLIDIFRGRTRPHAFSWLVWATLTAVGFGIAATNGGGAGTWQLGFTSVVCAVIFLLALQRGEKEIKTSDWACLIGAGAAGCFWLFAHGDVVSAILITVIDCLGFVPTFRKSFRKPHQETLSTQTIGIAKHGLSVLALSHFSIATVLYPLSLFFMNSVFAVFLMVRRQQLQLMPGASTAPHLDEAAAPKV
jgi:hypothetical protein